jgi:hypothetical protein
MGSISLQIPQIGLADTTEDVKVANNFSTIQTAINGNIDQTNLSATAGILLNSTTLTNPSRVVNTAYQPSTTRPTLLVVCVVGGGAGTNTVILKIGSTSSPTLVAGAATLTTVAGQIPITTIVPAGWWYSAVLSVGSATIPQVTEITL